MATRSRWTSAIVMSLRGGRRCPPGKNKCILGFVRSLLQNASIKAVGLNSRAKRRRTFSGQIARHKFVRLHLGTSAVGGAPRSRKLDDKLGIFKYFPLVLADQTKTNESLRRRRRRPATPLPSFPSRQTVTSCSPARLSYFYFSDS